MKNTLKKKLFKGLAGMITIIALIAITGLICIQVLKNTSDNIVVEYIELDSVQELRLSIVQIITPAYDYLYYQKEIDSIKFEQNISETFLHLNNLSMKLSNRHNKDLLTKIKTHLEVLHEKLLFTSYQNISNSKDSQVNIDDIENLINQINTNVQSILDETKEEIDEYMVIYQTSSKHSTLAIVFLTLILVIVSYKWGSKFVQKIISPINKLVQSTQIIGDGDLNVSTNVKTGDELEELASSFNKMIEKLNNVTVSRNYFDNLLANMLESLIVTDVEGKILTINKATIDLLKYDNKELLGKSFSEIISKDSKFNFDDFLKTNAKSDLEKTYLSKDGEKIPVLFSYSTMKDIKSKFSRIVFIAHDLRERIKIEQKLTKERREHLIAINEAQEKERLRIATEIHDGLGQMLTAISYSIENNFSETPKNNKEYSKQVIQLQKQIDDTIKESRIIASDLIPILLKDFGLVTAVENLINEIQSKYSIKVNFNTFNCSERLDSALEKALYRIIQEAINNIIKHSGATQSNIQIINHKDSVSVVIDDNGVGFENKTEKNKTKRMGIGLISMKERISAFNGFININSAKNKGTEIVIEIPKKIDV